MAVRVGVGEGWVVNDRDAGCIGRHSEKRGESVVAVDDVGHDDDDCGHRPVGDEPFLAVDHVAAVVVAVTAVVEMPDGSEPASASVTA